MHKLIKPLLYSELAAWASVLLLAIVAIWPFFFLKGGVTYEYVRLYLTLTLLFAVIPLCCRAARTAIENSTLSVVANDH